MISSALAFYHPDHLRAVTASMCSPIALLHRNKVRQNGEVGLLNFLDKLEFAGRARFHVLTYRLVTSKRSAAKR